MSDPPRAISVARDVAELAALGVLLVGELLVRDRDDALDAALAAAETTLRSAGVSEDAVQATRAMYRQFGVDPTKTRPSSEALWRRVRKGERLPRINTVVDVCNWCSLEFQVPYGLYDDDRIDGPIEFRRGRPGEQYGGIRKEVVHVADRPVLADRRGPFGNPTSDSARTMVTPATRRVLVVIFAPRRYAGARLSAALDVTAARLARYAGGRELWRAVVEGALSPPSS
jgi:DNA/RNA-binding domain of Phe-tRNA-synthetase-like protein